MYRIDLAVCSISRHFPDHGCIKGNDPLVDQHLYLVSQYIFSEFLDVPNRKNGIGKKK